MNVCAATGVPAAAACEIVKTYTPATSGVNETLVTDEKVPAFVALVLVTNGAVVVEAAVTTEVPPAAPRTGVPAVKTIPVLFAVAPAGAVVRSTVITEASGTALALKASVIVKVAAELTATAAEVLVGAIAEVFVSVTVCKVVAAVDGLSLILGEVQDVYVGVGALADAEAGLTAWVAAIVNIATFVMQHHRHGLLKTHLSAFVLSSVNILSSIPLISGMSAR